MISTSLVVAIVLLWSHLAVSWSVIPIRSLTKDHKSVAAREAGSIGIKDVAFRNNKKNKHSLIPSWFPSFGTAALGALLFGLDIGASSSVLRILGSGRSIFGVLKPISFSQIASGSLFGAILSSIAITVLGDRHIGRKTELMAAAFLFLLGSIIQASSVTIPILLLGRVLYGLGIGITMHASPLFIAETSPNQLRGRLISFKEAALVLGMVIGYSCGAIFGTSGNWAAIFFTATPIAATMLLGSLVIKESPRWLVLTNRLAEAKQSIQRIQGLSEIEANNTINAMTVSLQASDPSSVNSNVFRKLRELFSSKSNRRALLIGIGLVLFQQFTGQPSVLYFANRIFEQAGLGFQAAVGVAVFKLLMSLVSSSLVENPKVGRKKLLLAGTTGMTASLAALAVLYRLPATTWTQIAILLAMFLFVGCYSIGFGPITWLLLSEIFPLRVRSAAVSLGTLTNFTCNVLMTFLFEIERKRFGETFLFAQFSMIGLLSMLFTARYVFETQGLSLEQIENRLAQEASSQ